MNKNGLWAILLTLINTTLVPHVIDLELTMIFLYLMICSIQKKIIAKFCMSFKELWAFKIRYQR